MSAPTIVRRPLAPRTTARPTWPVVGTLVLVAVAWQLVATVVGVVLGQPAAPGEDRVLAHTAGWDGQWFLTAFGDGYATRPGQGAFYPLFPWAVHLVHGLAGGLLTPLAAGFVVDTVALAAILVGLWRLGGLLVPGREVWLVVVFLASPAAWFLHLFYSEGIFCALVVWATVAARERRWALACLLAGISTAGRITAVLLVLYVALEFVHSLQQRIPGTRPRQAAWLLLTPLGFGAYAAWLTVVRGDPWAMFHAYHEVPDWPYHVFDPAIWTTLAHQVASLAAPWAPWTAVSVAIPLATLLVLAATSVAALADRSGELLALGASGLAGVVMFTLNSNVVSVHRYTLPCLVIPVVLVRLLAGRRPGREAVLGGLVALGFSLQVYLAVLFLQGSFAG